MRTQKPIVFFDGICHLCNGFVGLLIKREPSDHFQFASLQREKETLPKNYSHRQWP
ncbi:MAG: DUF393 domain-containing protein [Bdellovibrionaceae bacterium]|nr:DUF393 domain-containing protein [Pseudobdellovibrionaceae bacterium]